jgi:hypothetical protein
MCHGTWRSLGVRAIGRLLLDTLIAATDAGGIWTIPSHDDRRFRVFGRHERSGRLLGPAEMAGSWSVEVQSLVESRSPRRAR